MSSDIKARFLAGTQSCGLPDADANLAKIGIAISGGADSIALLLLFHDCFPGQIAAATVDHKLRAEAAVEAQYVAGICDSLGIAHNILTPPQAITGNIQSAARSARYALLDRWANDNGCAVIATAHHADDQLETMLMRLARGSGLSGLSGVRRANGKIIRPLLAFTKAELIEICQTAAINPVHDPSNLDTDFDRVRMRNWLSATPNPMDAPSAARSASALDDADQALTWMTVRLIPERLTLHSNSATLDASGLPREIQRRLLLRALNHLEPNAVHRGSAIEDGLNRLSAGQTITLANTLCQGGITWHFTPAPPRNSAKMRRD